MKKMVFGFMALLICIAMISCDKKKAQLKLAAEKANLECPIDMGTVGSVVSITYDEDENVFAYEYNMKEDFNNIEVLSGYPELMKESTMINISNDKGDLRKTTEKVIEAEGSFKFIYHGMKTGATMEITLNNEELKTALDWNATARDAIEIELKMTNLQMPIVAGKGLMVTSVSIIGNDVTYITEMDPNLYQLSQLSQNGDAAKYGIINYVRNCGPVERNFLKKIADANMNLTYHYCYAGNPDGEACDVTLSNEDLSEILR